MAGHKELYSTAITFFIKSYGVSEENAQSKAKAEFESTIGKLSGNIIIKTVKDKLLRPY